MWLEWNIGHSNQVSWFHELGVGVALGPLVSEQAANPDESGTTSRRIGNASHDAGMLAQVCWRQR